MASPVKTDTPPVRGINMGQVPADQAPADRTYPPGTVIAPIPTPEMTAPNPSAGGEEHLSDGTMIVGVESQVQDTPGAAATGIPVALTLVSSPDPGEIGRRVTLSRFPFVVGRARDADLSLNGESGTISRHHLELDYHDGAFRISDNSTNGVFVNGRRLPRGEESALLFGDTIALSAQTSLRFVADVSRLTGLTGVMFDDRYELGEELYSSLKATTYLARDTRLPRTLTIKIFSPSLAVLADYREAYRREADVAARLGHPRIRKVIDRGEARLEFDGKDCALPYLCMDVMPGGNLSDRLERSDHPPELTLVRKWIRDLSEALAYAHGVDVVHGGLKPSAILFDEQDNPYLADFAQAKTEGSASSLLALGAPAFMAPEQWNGQPPSEASDQYAFACLVYLMLSGSVPYEGQADPQARRRNFERGPVPVHEQARLAGRSPLPSAASAVMAKALNVKPGERYPAITDFTLALEQAIATGRRSDGPPRVFLSYRRESSAGWAVLFARELNEKHAIEAFVDTQRRDSAVHFPEKLSRAISDCDVFVCLLARDTLESAWVCEEIRLADESGRPMVPVFQESFRDGEAHSEPHVRTLLGYDGIHLLDQRNIHVDHTISDLARIVQHTLEQKQKEMVGF